MSHQQDNSAGKDLDLEVLEWLASQQEETDLPEEQILRMRNKLLDQVRAGASADFITIRSSEGEWEKVGPRLHKKILNLDPATGKETYLLRAEPGARTPAHDHDHDELCYVLEGEIEFEHVTLQAGDYHYAPRGTLHSSARTRTGAVVLMQDI